MLGQYLIPQQLICGKGLAMDGETTTSPSGATGDAVQQLDRLAEAGAACAARWTWSPAAEAGAEKKPPQPVFPIYASWA
jgi:hypothetical protein